jgi:hypothetical protein
VRKGEKGSLVVYAGTVTKQAEAEADETDPREIHYPSQRRRDQATRKAPPAILHPGWWREGDPRQEFEFEFKVGAFSVLGL